MDRVCSALFGKSKGTMVDPLRCTFALLDNFSVNFSARCRMNDTSNAYVHRFDQDLRPSCVLFMCIGAEKILSEIGLSAIARDFESFLMTIQIISLKNHS